MKHKTSIVVAAVAIASLMALSTQAAEPKEVVGGAIKALKGKASYSWSTTSEMANSQFPAMTTKGKTENGLTLLTAESPNGEVQAVKKGEKGVVKTEQGWKTAEELSQGGQGGPGAGGGRGRFMSRRLLTTVTPAEEAEDLLKGIKELKSVEGGAFAAELTPEAAKDRAGFFGRRPQGGGQGGFTPPEPKDAKGTVKFWVKDGVLSKMELKTSAKITFQDNERDVDRTVTTEISGIGTTKVEVPEDAKKKL
jgi:hypothetical protein